MTRIRDLVFNVIGESRNAKRFFFFSFLVLLLFCFMLVYNIWGQAIRDTTAEAMKLASVAEAGIIKGNIKELEVNGNDLKKEAYNETKKSLKDIVAAHQNIRFAYILVLRSDQFYFAVDSEPPESKDYSPPGQAYPELASQARRPFQDGKPMILQNKDRWGNWMTVLIPMRDPGTQTILALFCVDYTPEMWYRNAVKSTAQAVVISICMILLYLCLVAILRTNESIRREKKKLSVANEKLHKEEELFRTVFEQSPMGISINNGGKVEYNSMYKKIIGRSFEEISADSWINYTHPEDLPGELELYEKFMRGELQSFNLNKRYVKPEGDIVWANVSVAHIILENREEEDYLCIAEDITERVKAEKDLRESERSYAMLLSNLPGMAYRCKYDRDWTMLFVSEGCYELTGYPAASLIQNSVISYNELISLKCQEYVWEKWSEAVAGKATFAGEYEIVTASGETKWVFEQGQAIYDETGNVDALEGLIIDITDRKHKEDEIVFLNNHDFLTGLYNRRFLEQAKGRVDREEYLPLSVMIGDINGVKMVNDAFGHAEGDILIQETAKIIGECCRESDIAARTGGDEFVILMPNTGMETANRIMDRIKQKCEEYNKDLSNEAYSINISLGYATKETADANLDATTKIAEDFMYKRKLLEHKSSHSVILSSIKATMHEKSHETQEHADRLTYLSKEIGKIMKLAQEDLDELELVATLHDIGKVAIDDHILNKPGKLNDEEWIEMKKHSEIGYRIAMSSPDLVPVAEYILSLHERWDGGGYPQGIKGEEIPLISRIVSVVDAYDAMTEDRIYRKAVSGKEAAGEIKRNAGTQFDPKVVKLFLEKVLPNYMADRKIKL